MITTATLSSHTPADSGSSSRPDQRVSYLTSALSYFTPAPTFEHSRSFSLLRILGLASLFSGARAQLFPVQFELSSLSGIGGFALSGEQRSEESGYSVSIVGDVNADGIADFVIGAPEGTSATGDEASGKVYVVFGRRGLGPFELASLDGTNGFVLDGEQSRAATGLSVCRAGDVNADDIDDLLIGAPLADPSPDREAAGKTYVVFGKAGLGASGRLELSRLDGTNGFVLNGERTNDNSGRSVSSAGDINADGITDFLIGAYHANPAGIEDAGKTYAIFGKRDLGAGGEFELFSLDGTNGVALNGESRFDESGEFVSSAGDVNGDGIADLLVGAGHADPASGREGAGKTYIVFGRSSFGASGTFELSSLRGTNGFVLNGEMRGDGSGTASGVGDINGDGITDLIIGAPWADPTPDREDAGRVYLVFGKAGLGANGILELSGLGGATGLFLNGELNSSRTGFSVSSAGDLNADGIADLVIGAHQAALGPDREFAGKTYVVFGRSGLGEDGTFELSGLNGRNGFVLNGEASGDWAGWSLSSAGDINADGIADLVIGARLAEPTIVRNDAGKTYVVFGRKTTLPPPASLPGPATLSTDRLPSSDGSVSGHSNGIVVPLGIGGGVCALAASVGTAVLVFLRKNRSADERELCPAAQDSKPVELSPNAYDKMPSSPVAYGDTNLYPHPDAVRF